MFIVLGALIVLVGLPLFFSLHTTPTCSDGLQNGDETGIDCGGGCQLICSSSTLPLLIQGDPRLLQIATSTYEVVALVQNPNVTGQVVRANYTFKVFTGSDTKPLQVITGSTFIPKNSTFALFQGPFSTGTSTVNRVVFEWDQVSLVWEKNTDMIADLVSKDLNFTNSTTSARLDATLSNQSIKAAQNIEVVSLLYDENGNIVGAGKTFVDTLDGGGSVPLVFTWPSAFKDKIVSIQVVPHILPDRSYLK